MSNKKSSIGGALNGMKINARTDLREAMRLAMGFANKYDVVCRDKNGKIKWIDHIENIVVNTGLDDILEEYFNGSAYTAAHYVGLTDGTPTVAAGDTMASHAGWTEPTGYDEATRPAYSPATVSSQSVTNSASVAVFSINATLTIGGCFITTNSTKGGATGTLYGAGAFTGGDKSVSSGDTLNVTVTCTSAAA